YPYLRASHHSNADQQRWLSLDAAIAARARPLARSTRRGRHDPRSRQQHRLLWQPPGDDNRLPRPAWRRALDWRPRSASRAVSARLLHFLGNGRADRSGRDPALPGFSGGPEGRAGGAAHHLAPRLQALLLAVVPRWQPDADLLRLRSIRVGRRVRRERARPDAAPDRRVIDQLANREASRPRGR